MLLYTGGARDTLALTLTDQGVTAHIQSESGRYLSCVAELTAGASRRLLQVDLVVRDFSFSLSLSSLLSTNQTQQSGVTQSDVQKSIHLQMS